MLDWLLWGVLQTIPWRTKARLSVLAGLIPDAVLIFSRWAPLLIAILCPISLAGLWLALDAWVDPRRSTEPSTSADRRLLVLAFAVNLPPLAAVFRVLFLGG